MLFVAEEGAAGTQTECSQSPYFQHSVLHLSCILNKLMINAQADEYNVALKHSLDILTTHFLCYIEK